MLFIALSMFSLVSSPIAGIGYLRIAIFRLYGFICFGHWISSVLGPGPLGTELSLLVNVMRFSRAGYALCGWPFWRNLAGSHFGPWPIWVRFGPCLPPHFGPWAHLGPIWACLLRASYALATRICGWPIWRNLAGPLGPSCSLFFPKWFPNVSLLFP